MWSVECGLLTMTVRYLGNPLVDLYMVMCCQNVDHVFTRTLYSLRFTVLSSSVVSFILDTERMFILYQIHSTHVTNIPPSTLFASR